MNFKGVGLAMPDACASTKPEMHGTGGQMKVNPFVLSKIFVRWPKGVGNKQGLWLLFGARLRAYMRPLLLFTPLIFMTKKAVS
ncbi:MAG: hypothetical protein WC091_03905 [Sulfuricellaceae bacterium]